MSPLAQALNLPRTRLFRALGGITALLAFTLALLAGSGMLLQQLYSTWQLQRHNSVMLYLPPETPAAELSPLTTTLPTLAGVASARPVPVAELQAALAPLLPATLSPSSLPLPVVLEIRLKAGAERPKVLGALQQLFPLAELDDQQTTLGRIAESVRLLQGAALGLGLLLAGVLATLMAVLLRAGLLAQASVVQLLLQLGATDAALARTLTLQALSPVALGTGVGVGLAALLLLGAGLWPGSPLVAAAGTWAALLLTPWLLPLIAALSGWFTSLGLLQHHDEAA